ncbi:MAG: Mrp/NBP35 family ATP-binding protein [Microthrixaceae bacterium]|nr:Mrp/NBP35 family ATP-binding protein [Microthrixaceae bacterium]
MTVSEASVTEALRPVQDPELRRSIVDLNMVREVAINRSSVRVLVALTTPATNGREELERRVSEAIASLDGVKVVQVDFTLLDDAEREELRKQLHGDPQASAGTQQGQGHAEGRAVPFAEPGNHTRVLLCASGKGGVGKSSVTTNLAVALTQRGKSVGVVDADVYGFSIPKMLGIDTDPVLLDQMIIPPESHGVRAMSMGFFAEEETPIIWRGPMLHKALEQFLTDVFWDEPDYLLVDLPPGTGDISISIAQYLPRSELYVVTTPQPAAQRVAQRAAYMAHKLNITVRGVIENMSWFTADDEKRYELFGSGGGQALADQLDVPLLGQIPLMPQLREGGDVGKPITVANSSAEASQAFASIAERIDVELAPTRRTHRELRITG